MRLNIRIEGYLASYCRFNFGEKIQNKKQLFHLQPFPLTNSLDSKYAKLYLPLYQLTQMLTEYDHAKNTTTTESNWPKLRSKGVLLSHWHLGIWSLNSSRPKNSIKRTQHFSLGNWNFLILNIEICTLHFVTSLDQCANLPFVPSHPA